jgi:hypothetical protein
VLEGGMGAAGVSSSRLMPPCKELGDGVAVVLMPTLARKAAPDCEAKTVALSVPPVCTTGGGELGKGCGVPPESSVILNTDC